MSQTDFRCVIIALENTDVCDLCFLRTRTACLVSMATGGFVGRDQHSKLDRSERRLPDTQRSQVVDIRGTGSPDEADHLHGEA